MQWNECRITNRIERICSLAHVMVRRFFQCSALSFHMPTVNVTGSCALKGNVVVKSQVRVKACQSAGIVELLILVTSDNELK